MRESSENIMRTIDISRQLLIAADLGDLLCEDNRCSVFYDLVRKSANKILNEAELERSRHINRGVWGTDVKTTGKPKNKGGKKPFHNKKNNS